MKLRVLATAALLSLGLTIPAISIAQDRPGVERRIERRREDRHVERQVERRQDRRIDRRIERRQDRRDGVR